MSVPEQKDQLLFLLQVVRVQGLTMISSKDRVDALVLIILQQILELEKDSGFIERAFKTYHCLIELGLAKLIDRDRAGIDEAYEEFVDMEYP